MNTRLLPMSFLVSLLSISAWAQESKVDDYVREEMRQRKIPGLTLAVIQNGKVVKQTAYGLANVELNVPATLDTVYQIASVTKSFTGAAIMALVEEGRLSLDDKVAKWLPSIPAAWNEVTVRHCLTHTSGLPDLHEDECSEYIADTREEALQKLARLPVVSKPGEKWSYNQTGFMLAGMIIETLSGMSFEDFLHQRFFRPLGMTSTRFGDYREIIPKRASIYTRYKRCRVDEKVSPDKIYTLQNGYVYEPFMYPGAGLNTTSGDLVKWNLAVDSGRVLKKATLDEMWMPVKLNDGKVLHVDGTLGYAIGWSVDDRPGHKAVGHSGGDSTSYWRFVDDKLTVIVLTNCQGADPRSLVRGVAALYVPAIAAE